MKWLLENLGFAIVMVIAVVSFIRSALRALKNPDENAGQRRLRPEEDPEAAERTRRIQEEIRRKIAERRGVSSPAADRSPTFSERVETVRERIPPLVRPQPTPSLDPFGGPMRKILREFEREREPTPAAVLFDQGQNAEDALARQRALDEQLRALEAARATEQRRAAELAATRAERRSSQPAGAARGRELHDLLRNKSELRRAFLLREILDRPVGLR